MARIKLVARIAQSQLRWENEKRPNPKILRSGVKNIEGRIRNRGIKAQ